MLSEFLIELKLNEEHEKITQIMTGSNNSQMKPSAYDELSMPARARSSRREKAKVEKGRTVSRIGDNHAMTTGVQMAVNLDTTVPNTIPGDNQADARYVVQRDTIHHSAQDQ